ATKKATTKATEVKEVKEVKVEAPVAEVKEVKAEAKKAPAKKAPAKKAATTEKKAPAKKAAAKAETVITLEFGDYTAIMATVEEKVKAQFVADGHKASSIKTLNIYVKPFENSAYYVINDDVTGRVDLF
ncbi:MAG: hypothetical protein IJ958_08590, partial [Agathobacter sp.]|nr:hypothetical protein [Agathobacter sp.]